MLDATNQPVCLGVCNGDPEGSSSRLCVRSLQQWALVNYLYLPNPHLGNGPNL